MPLVQLTLAEINLIATHVLNGEEAPFSEAFEAATSEFYNLPDFDASDRVTMGQVAVVELPADAVISLPRRLYGAADALDIQAHNAALNDHDRAESLHRNAGCLRALAVHTARTA